LKPFLTNVSSPKIQFASSSSAWGFSDWVRDAIADVSAHAVCEVGGGAKPLLSASSAAELGVDYVVADRSEPELRKAPGPHRRVVVDVGSPGFTPFGRFDVVCSRMVLEHVRDPRRFHENVWSLLRPGGVALHFFSTLYDAPFVLNRVLPETLVATLLRVAQPNRTPEGNDGKFPASYRWCRGPTRSQIRRLESTGFAVERYVGFFGHWYLARMPRLQRLEDTWARSLVRHPNPWLTTFAWVRLRRPAWSTGG
jgi:SAM-dependent methyltransferase